MIASSVLITCETTQLEIIHTNSAVQTALGQLYESVWFVNPCLCIHGIKRTGQSTLLICCRFNLGLFTLRHT